ncbi:MAG: hypothetical protein ABJQ34_02160 [Paracoccaceae bacterium]
MAYRPSATVGSALRTILPRGTNLEVYKPEGVDDHDERYLWQKPPYFAPDLFAATAYLCKVGGVVSYFNPSPYGGADEASEFFINREDRDAANKAANEWRAPANNLRFPDLCRSLWDNVFDAWEESLNPGAYDHVGGKAPAWWSAALRLVMISDMACARIMRNKLVKYDTDGVEIEQPEEPFEIAVKTKYNFAKQRASDKGKEFRSPASLTYMVDESVACVLPKMRVAPVGATLRNVSRNLSLLPGKGEVRCLWSNMASNAIPNEDHETLDVLLIPEPRKLNSLDFEAEDNEDRPNGELRRNKWAWDNFELKQNWIDSSDKRSDFVADCIQLLRKAKEQSACVNAVVLPEYAIDYDMFERLCTALKTVEPGLEFVISGSSSNCEGQKGNIVVTRVWDDRRAPEFYITDSRRKHHRWRMNRSQVETYALSAALNPKIENWWEKTPLGRRELFFHRFRKASVFSVLICEELARSDPCHEILRSVAPNLIFALLLDGPQIRNRWPAQYASNLADDPGSSVLTFTSYGLIERSNQQGHFEPNHSIAMWKDDSGKIVEIPMPQGDGPRGVLLSLWPEHVRDITITGKRSEERAWRYASHFPIVL